MSRSIVVGLVVALVAAGPAFAFDQSGNERYLRDARARGVDSLKAYQMIRSAFAQVDPNFEVVWHEASALPRAVFVHGSPGLRDSVLRSLERALPSGLSLRLESRDDRRSVHRYVFAGTPLHPGLLTCSTTPGGVLLVGDFPTDVRVSARPKGPMDWHAAAVQFLGSTELLGAVWSEAVLFDSNQGLLHARLVRVPSRHPLGEFVLAMDATTGFILWCNDYASAVDGTASVYLRDPLKDAATVQPIAHLAPGGRLQGSFITVENEDTVTAASSSTNQFVYPPSDKHFDEGNVYYHLDRAHAWHERTFGFTATQHPIAAGVYYGDQFDNAMFLGWANAIVFGDGDRYNVLSRDASVAYHEYAHAVTAAIAPLGSLGEAGAMNEGFSDYFAATLGDCPDVGAWVVAKLDRPYLRSCVNDSHYPESVSHESHKDSQLWSAPLWELRQTLGAPVVDRLAHLVRYRLNDEASFAVGLRALLAVDEQEFAGAHRQVIVDTFARRGIAANDVRFREAARKRAVFELLSGRR